jgi:hypothetical protein
VLLYYIESGEAPEVASEAEIEVMLKELGLPVGLIEHMQTADSPGHAVESICAAANQRAGAFRIGI